MADTVIEFPAAQEFSKVAPPLSETFFLRRATSVNSPTGPISITGLRTSGSKAYRVIEIDKLYPATEGTIAEVSKAIGLLADAVGFLDRARLCIENSPLQADRELQHVQQLLPALFVCRKIGDGFASVVNSLQFAFINLHGQLLSKAQVTAIWRILKELRSKPFLSFDQSLGLVAELEDANLKVDPEVLAKLIEDE